MIKSDEERLKKIIKLWETLNTEITNRGITKDLLMQDEFLQWAVTTPVYNIGEQVYQLSRDIKEEHSEVCWSVVSGLRHRLVHDYEGINWEIISEVIFNDMNPFVEQVKKILNDK